VRRLFVKIFLWFWLSTSLVLSAFVLTTWWTDSRPPTPPWHEDLMRVVRVYGDLSIREYERSGVDACESLRAVVERQAGVDAYIVDAHGTAICGRALPDEIRGALDRFRAGVDDPFRPSHGGVLGLEEMRGPSGGSYVVAVAFALQRPFGPTPSAARLVVRLAVAVLVAGLGCYGLAYYLTLPLTRLRLASRRLASGDLAARAGTRLQARRDEFGELGRDFDEMAERLESFVASERRLLRDISHELRSPLARLGVALGLARHTTNPETVFALDRIELESERLNDLIGRLLTLAKLQSGEVVLRRKPVALDALVADVVADASFEVGESERRVEVHASEPVTVLGDESLLKSAVENVVRNAIRHTPKGTTVEVGLRREGADAVIQVRDHGAGVPESAIDEIFRPFYRVEDARDRVSGGAGLGLAIAQGAVALHGGSVEAANDPERGLRVTIRLRTS